MATEITYRLRDITDHLPSFETTIGPNGKGEILLRSTFDIAFPFVHQLFKEIKPSISNACINHNVLVRDLLERLDLKKFGIDEHSRNYTFYFEKIVQQGGIYIWGESLVTVIDINAPVLYDPTVYQLIPGSFFFNALENDLDDLRFKFTGPVGLTTVPDSIKKMIITTYFPEIKEDPNKDQAAYWSINDKMSKENKYLPCAHTKCDSFANLKMVCVYTATRSVFAKRSSQFQDGRGLFVKLI